jgi:hypothetical protein
MLRLSSAQDVLSALRHARTIEAEAYTMHGPVLAALEEAARRGARVTVQLEAQPFDNPRLARENGRVIGALRAAGVDATLGHPLHAKKISADGSLFFDDQNWGMHDLVLRSDEPSDAGDIPMCKSEALAEEAALLREPGNGDAIVQTESFSCCNSVWSALETLARAGKRPRLLVNERVLRANPKEQATLRALVAQGVDVRVCPFSEKLAIAGTRAWVGSANATVAFGESNMSDWGVRTSDPAIVAAVRARIEAHWSCAKTFRTD